MPASGGKDSTLVAHMLKNDYGMHPLTVTWSPHIYTDIGRKNLTSFIDAGFDNILVTPNGEVHRKLTKKAAFLEMGDPFQPFIFGQYSAPLGVALQYNVDLVFYGEDGEVEYGGAMEYADRAFCYDKFVENRFSNIFPDSFMKYGVSAQDLNKYGLSKAELQLIKARGVQQHFFSYYRFWLPQENYYYSVENAGFEANPERNGRDLF